MSRSSADIIADYVMSDDTSELAKTKAELAYALMSLEREMAICHQAGAEIERLRKAAHDAFMAMCSHRDNPDDEVFQDAIDAIGVAAERGGPES